MSGENVDTMDDIYWHSGISMRIGRPLLVVNAVRVRICIHISPCAPWISPGPIHELLPPPPPDIRDISEFVISVEKNSFPVLVPRARGVYSAAPLIVAKEEHLLPRYMYTYIVLCLGSRRGGRRKCRKGRHTKAYHIGTCAIECTDLANKSARTFYCI